MTLKEMLMTMLRSFFIIITGEIVAVWLFCTALVPEALFTVDFLSQMLLLTLACVALFVVFYSPKELGKVQVRIRMAIHLALLITIVLSLLIVWGWIEPCVPHVLAAVGLVLLVYACVTCTVFYRDRQTAMKFNEVLKKYNSK